MPHTSEMPKAYAPADVEPEILNTWEASGFFDPDRLPDRNQHGEPYCIVLPPPNRTGTLHMGHAKMLAIEDILIRFYRMNGCKTYWVPGTDHAAIATQVKVEQLLIKEGITDPRKTLGREAFLERVKSFAEQSRMTIIEQCKRMGASMDWKREKYTLDAERNRAVNTMFAMMYEDGLIERGYRVVNWDPQFLTTLSDDEVLSKDIKARLVTFTYDKDFPIAISTTRPETKFGDTAVAVHPDDERYRKFVGKTFEPTFCGKKLTIAIIADTEVDPTFGTGALGVTPAHSMIDAEMAERHGLPTVRVIDEQAKMMNVPELFVGKTTIEARQMIEDRLIADGLLVKAEEIDQALPVAERGGAAVEQLPMKQWFVRVNKPFTVRQDTLGKWKKGEKATLKELMSYAVASKQTRIIPENFEKVYFHWIDHLRDWCISRQIWFGHQIPVWYKGDELSVTDVSPGEGWERDPDTLDTWFSSGMWTFSVLGWPEKTTDLATYHPTNVLETGRDILFFWVARMVLMSSYALGEVPFRDTYLHGLVTDEQGRKMSKSLGNILDPLDIIPKYGTDAARLSLIMGTSPGIDQKLSEDKIKDFRNFTNKLWNIARFMLSYQPTDASKENIPLLADRWILVRLDDVARSVTKKIHEYKFAQAGDELRDFTWGELADWYLEIVKTEPGDKTDILRRILQTILRLWHPFMPFVTEHLWRIAGFEGLLMVAEWPTFVASVSDEEARDLVAFSRLSNLVTDMRRLRSEQKVDATKKAEFALTADEALQTLLKENVVWMERLTHASALTIVPSVDGSWPTTMSGTSTIALNLAGAVDVEQERLKNEKELSDVEAYCASLEGKLANQEFVGKAPAKVVDDMRRKLEEAKERQAQLKARIG